MERRFPMTENGKQSDGRKVKIVLIGIGAVVFLALAQAFLSLVWPNFKIPEIVYAIIGGMAGVAYPAANVIQKGLQAKNGNGKPQSQLPTSYEFSRSADSEMPKQQSERLMKKLEETGFASPQGKGGATQPQPPTGDKSGSEIPKGE
jgi:uncharacterized membrane protein YeaQ/YmgE (transglycosylase-associated protein family)